MEWKKESNPKNDGMMRKSSEEKSLGEHRVGGSLKPLEIWRCTTFGAGEKGWVASVLDLAGTGKDRTGNINRPTTANNSGTTADNNRLPQATSTSK